MLTDRHFYRGTISNVFLEVNPDAFTSIDYWYDVCGRMKSRKKRSIITGNKITLEVDLTSDDCPDVNGDLVISVQTYSVNGNTLMRNRYVGKYICEEAPAP